MPRCRARTCHGGRCRRDACGYGKCWQHGGGRAQHGGATSLEALKTDPVRKAAFDKWMGDLGLNVEMAYQNMSPTEIEELISSWEVDQAGIRPTDSYLNDPVASQPVDPGLRVAKQEAIGSSFAKQAERDKQLQEVDKAIKHLKWAGKAFTYTDLKIPDQSLAERNLRKYVDGNLGFLGELRERAESGQQYISLGIKGMELVENLLNDPSYSGLVEELKSKSETIKNLKRFAATEANKFRQYTINHLSNFLKSLEQLESKNRTALDQCNQQRQAIQQRFNQHKAGIDRCVQEKQQIRTSINQFQNQVSQCQQQKQMIQNQLNQMQQMAAAPKKKKRFGVF